MEEFIKEWSWLSVMVVFIVEHLIAASKLKSNSTIELLINVVKYVFGMDKPKELE